LKTFSKYFLIQIPGWIVAAILLYWGWHLSWVPTLWALGIFAIWVAKDFFLYPLVKIGYETNTKSVVENLIGYRGIAKDHLNPKGYVEVRAELWQGEIDPEMEPISPGSPIRITGVRGRTLIVKKDLFP